MKRLLTFFFLLFFLLVKPVHAEDFVIDSFHSDIAIGQDGIVNVRETLVVDFAQNEKHGIFRELPVVYADDRGAETYTQVAFNDVERNNTNEPYEIERNSGNIRVRIGDANRTISGKHTYIIDYSVRGVLRGFPGHDELYWNVTGNNWNTTINNASATVLLPKNGMKQVACYQGPIGATGQCYARIASGEEAEFRATQQLSPNEGITIAAGYEKGLVPILSVERPKTFWEKFIEWPSQVTLWTGILGVIGFIGYTWYKNGRDLWFGRSVTEVEKGKEIHRPLFAGKDTVVVEFTPPDKLTPAEIGVLMDERADTTDVVATIIDLATRGYLTITEIPKKWVFGSADYELVRKKQPDNPLKSYEKLLLTSLFATGDHVKISSLKNTFYDELAEVKSKLYASAVEDGLFPKNPESIRATYIAWGIVLVVLGSIAVSATISYGAVFLADIAFALVVGGILMVLLSAAMPRRSAHGRELYRRAQGYRLFIEKAEKHRQQFFEKKNLFNEVLPYAIMFGLTDKFFNAMKDMGIKTQPAWYHGTRPFTYGAFNASMNTFAAGMSTAIASTPSKSGGFSGGSSGGGFGGGGGGSW